jgi:hypothetical protein
MARFEPRLRNPFQAPTFAGPGAYQWFLIGKIAQLARVLTEPLEGYRSADEAWEAGRVALWRLGKAA